MTKDICDKPIQGSPGNRPTDFLSYPRRWTLAEIQSLREMAQEQISKHEIAARLNRSTNSLEIQARKLGIKFVRIKKTHWLATKRY
jgi:hypothetical protein